MDNDLEQQTRRLLAPPPDALASVHVFPLILSIRKDVMTEIDSAMSWDQLTAADVNYTTVQPLVRKYTRSPNPSTVYASLVVRSHFLSLASHDVAHASTMLSRASLCELLAMKLCRFYANDRLVLAHALTACWVPTAGAPDEVVAEIRDAVGGGGGSGGGGGGGGADDVDLEDPNCALELAIHTKSKRLLASSVVQAIVNDIYAGKIVYTPSSSSDSSGAIALEPEDATAYKPGTLRMYDVRSTPFLDHYRLRVPRYNALLEFMNFALLMITFCLCLAHQSPSTLGPYEAVFMLLAAGFVLNEYSQAREHGWTIYVANLWNALDGTFLVICVSYFVLRAKGLAQNDHYASELSFNILACGACILFPRLAFFAIRSNVVILALRGMITEFVFFMGVAAICFSGVLFTLWMLAGDRWTLKSIAWLMVQIWFGNTSLSFSEATSFHKILGPILLVTFAILCNYLLITMLMAILSSTFARINSNATQEYLFQFTVSTIEGVKSDALFSFQPPFNVLAYIVLIPASKVLSSQTFHSLNVLLIKITTFPILVAIGIYERYFVPHDDADDDDGDTNPRRTLLRSVSFIRGHTMSVYEAIFDVELPVEQEEALYRAVDGYEDEMGLGGGKDDKADLRSVSSMQGIGYSQPPVSPSAKGPSRSPVRGRERSAVRDQGALGLGLGPGGLAPGSATQLVRRTRRPMTTAPQVRVPLNPDEADYEEDSSANPPTSRFARLVTLPRLTVSTSENNAALANANANSNMNVMQVPMQMQMPLPPVSEETLAGIRRLETMLEQIHDARTLPVQRIKEEIEDIQHRQGRIETLLLTLTRAMRHETGPRRSGRN